MSKSRVLLLCALALLCALGFSGCSGSNTIAITLSPTTVPTLDPGQTQAITATLTNDKNSQGVTWSLSGIGTLTSQTTTSVTYVAPNTVPAATSVTITATSVANTTVTATLNITLNAVFQFSTTSLPAGTVNVPYSGEISVTGSTGPFTWAITAGTLPPGLTLSSSTAASISVVGTPSVVGTSNFTIQCTDSAGNAVTESLSIKIEVPPPLSVGTKSLPNATENMAYFPPNGFQLIASSGTAPYTWTITSGMLPTGSMTLSSAGVLSGTPNEFGIFPFTVQVTDSSTPNPQVATGNLSLTVAETTVDNLLMGNYAFLLSGFGPNGHFVAAGSFVSDGLGDITGGTMDSNTPSAYSPQNLFTASYSIFTNDLGTITLGGSEGGRVFYIAMQPDGTAGKIIETDATGTHASGVLLQQNTSDFSASSITGTYAFGFLGTDSSAARYGFAGEVSASGGVFSNGEVDSDDAGMPPFNGSCSGSYSVATPSTTGRGTGTLTINGVITNYTFYIVSSSQLLFMETDNAASAPLVSGSMLKQGSPSFNGTSVFETTALQTSGGTQTAIGQVGLLGASSGSALTSNVDQNSGGTMSGPTSNSGTFSVGTGGRVTLTGSGLAASDPVLYLVNSNEAFIIGTDANVTFGFMENQNVPSSGQFTAASLSGVYLGGSVAPILSAGNNQVDSATADGVQNFNPINTDSSSNGLNQTSSATYSVVTNGRGVLKNGGTELGVIYIVSPVGGSSPSEYYELYTDPFAMVEVFQQ